MDAQQAEMLKATLHLARTRALFGMDGIYSDYLSERLWMNLDTSRRMVAGDSFFSTLLVEESLNAIDCLIEHSGDEHEKTTELRELAVGYGELIERESLPVTARMVREFVVLARVAAMFSASRNRSEADPRALAEALGEARNLIEANRVMVDDPFLDTLVTEAGKASRTLEGLGAE